MLVDLKYILSKNKISLEVFIKKNKLDTFEKFLAYCELRKFIPSQKEEYEEINKILCPKNDVNIELKQTDAEIIIDDGSVSKTQKEKKSRNSNKRKHSS